MISSSPTWVNDAQRGTQDMENEPLVRKKPYVKPSLIEYGHNCPVGFEQLKKFTPASLSDDVASTLGVTPSNNTDCKDEHEPIPDDAVVRGNPGDRA